MVTHSVPQPAIWMMLSVAENLKDPPTPGRNEPVTVAVARARGTHADP